MNDVRLKTAEYEFQGKKYTLRCNMNVLADVQEAFGGNMQEALSEKSSLRACLTFLASMLNDYADEMGLEERFTSRQVGRILAPWQLKGLEGVVFPLVTAALRDEECQEEEGKNGETTREEAKA